MLTNVKIFVRLEVMLYVCIRKQLKYIIMKTYIQKKIEKLMQTSTGKAMCDSGGENGRHWQRNQKRKLDFNDDVKLDEYGATIPIHVYMNTMFECDDVTAMFNRKLSKSYFWVGEAFDVLSEAFELDVDGYLCSSEPNNTYNSENDLSQDFQYQLFEFNGDVYCLFQLHQGADIRGGYTSVQVFKVNDPDYFFIGWSVDFYDNSNNEQFESYYSIDDDDRYELNEKKQCFINKETKEEVYPYSAATGY